MFLLNVPYSFTNMTRLQHIIDSTLGHDGYMKISEKSHMKAFAYESRVDTQEELLRRIELVANELSGNRLQILRATKSSGENVH